MCIRWGKVEAGMQFLWMLRGAGDAKSGHWSGQKLGYRARSWVSMATAVHGSHHRAQRASKATLNSCLLAICFVLCVVGFFFFSFLLNKKAARFLPSMFSTRWLAGGLEASWVAAEPRWGRYPGSNRQPGRRPRHCTAASGLLWYCCLQTSWIFLHHL